MIVLYQVGGWYQEHRPASTIRRRRRRPRPTRRAPRPVAAPDPVSIAVLVALIFSKYFYLASLSSYYTFYLISKFHVSVRAAQIDLFIFLGSVAAGTILGGPIGDRFGRKLVIWVSILGVFPFTMLLPHANLFWTRDPHGHHRPDPRVGVLGDRRLRAGAGARARRA